MALLKQCNICKNKGFRLKLKEGLCLNCFMEFENLEQNYSNLLNEISLPSSNKGLLLSQLKNIVSHMPKFETNENSMKLLNYKTQLTILENNLPLKNKEDNETNSVTSPTKDISTSESILTTEPNSIISSMEDISISKPILVKESSPKNTEPEVTIKEEIPSILISKEEAKEEIDTNINKSISKEIFLENSKDKENLNTTNSPKVPIGNIEKNTIKNSDSSLEKLNHTKLLNNLYHKTANIIEILNNNYISDNSFAENFFLLKNEIFPLLKEHHIEKVSDENLIDFIEKKENILSIRTNQKKEDLFDFFNYVAFSIQTTGIKANLSDIIEISALKIKYGKIVDEFYTLVNPNKSIKILIEQRTGISTDDVKNAPQIFIALEKFLTFSENLKLISHNENFTTSFLNFNCNKINGHDIKNKTGCTMKLYRIRYKSYYGVPTENFDILNCAKDLLSKEQFNELNNTSSIAKFSTLATFNLYEIIKYKYK